MSQPQQQPEPHQNCFTCHHVEARPNGRWLCTQSNLFLKDTFDCVVDGGAPPFNDYCSLWTEAYSDE